MDSLDVPPSRPPPPPPPKRLSRPKITLQIPESAAPMTPRGPPTGTSVYWGTPRFHGKPPTTPASHISDPRNPYFSPFAHMYHSKASEFMFKQFEGFKDFTMNTAKSGLSAGEKTAFWFYNRLRSLSKKWFTHLFLTLCLVLYSVIGAAVFMAIEGPHEERVDKDLAGVRLDLAAKIEEVWREEKMEDKQANMTVFLSKLEQELATYELNFTEAMKQINNNDTRNKTWGFWNSMFYAGTIYTTIDICYDPDVIKKYLVRRRFYERCFHKTVMSEVGNEEKSRLTLKIPIIRAETETQTLGQLVSRSPEKAPDNMEAEQKMSIRKRRNLSKNRPQASRQREKTPEPGRTLVPHEDTTSDEEEVHHPVRNSREIEADNTYEEMRRLVQEKASVKDPIYDINTDEVMEARALAANERRRRSISPFALPDNDAPCKLERKGSFIDPTNKLLSTQYFASPKEDEPSRRSSLTIEPPKDRSSISPPGTASPKDKEPPYPIPATPKKLEEMVYADEVREQKVSIDKPRQLRSPIAKDKEGVFTFEEKDVKPSPKATSPKAPDTPTPRELVTKVIEVERTPSRKLTQESKPVVEVRERIVRTPSKKLTADVKPVIKQQPPVKDDPKLKVPPVKPARSKSATRFGNKTSESEMSEDQLNLLNAAAAPKRKVVPTPRRFMKNRSPRANRSQSVNRADELQVASKSGVQMTKTAKDIIELLEKRARSLSISKDDPRLPVEYQYSRNLQTPNKTPVSRTSRGISCPKTIQIISGSEILSGIKPTKKVEAPPQRKRTQSSGYIDASQSEYTSSCYSSSPSENEFNFDLSERTAELTRKLNLLSQDSDKPIDAFKVKHNTSLVNEESIQEATSVLRKRSTAETRNGVKNERRKSLEDKKANKKADVKTKQLPKSKWKFIANWQEFKMEHKYEYEGLFLLRNRCICDLIILIIMCGLGGLMFKSLEGSFENAYKCGSRGVKRDFLESLWRGSHYLREEDWKSMARKKLYEFENQLLTAHEAGVTSYSGQRSWNFMNSFVYCLTLITTIGYGHISPKTTYGRVATIVYAVIGIPLFLIVLADFGKLFTRIIKFFWSFIRRFYYTRSCKKVRRTVPVQEVMKGLNTFYDVVRRPSQIFSEEDLECPQPPALQRKPSDAPPPLPPKPKQVIDVEADTEPDTPAPSVFEIDDEFNVPISVALFILVVYIIIGGAGFSMWEHWNFFESFYFVFISMSTIGLGDLVPNHPIFMMASILYLVFGLALTSMCINVVQVKLSDTFKKASAKLGATIGLKVAEEDGSLVPITPPPTEIAPVHKPKAVAPKPKESDENDSKPKESNENDSKPKESNENDSKTKESDENDSKNR